MGEQPLAERRLDASGGQTGGGFPRVDQGCSGNNDGDQHRYRTLKLAEVLPIHEGEGDHQAQVVGLQHHCDAQQEAGPHREGQIQPYVSG